MGKQKLKDIERRERKKTGEPKGKKQVEEKPKIEKKQVDMRQIIRLAETNVDGRLPVYTAIRSVKGVGFMLGNAISTISGFGDKKLSDLSEQELKHLEDMIMEPEKTGLPIWLFNRRRDPVSGKDRHIPVSKLELTTKMDLNEMKKLKTYKGIRHSAGLPVRGQRTRSSFRKSGKAVGVSKKKQMPQKSKKKGK